MRKQSTSQIIGRDGERWFQSILPPQWILNKPTEDFGIDFIVAIGDEENVTSFEFGVQVKTRKHWHAQGRKLVVSQLSLDVLRYWSMRLTPTLLVAYEASTKKGYYIWVPEILTEEVLQRKCATTSLSIPMKQKLTEKSWPSIKEELLRYHRELAASLGALKALRPVIKAINSFAQSSMLLRIAETSSPKEENEKMLLDLSQALAHREVIVALESLAENIGASTHAGTKLLASSSAYRSLCEEIYHPFDAFMKDNKDQAVAFWANKEKTKELLPKLLMHILTTMAFLTGMAEANTWLTRP